jgi:hypothetical protein
MLVLATYGAAAALLFHTPYEVRQRPVYQKRQGLQVYTDLTVML